MPFLLLYGSRDRLTPPEDREKLQSLCPRFTQHAVPGAGHAPQCGATMPYTAGVLLDFLGNGRLSEKQVLHAE